MTNIRGASAFSGGYRFDTAYRKLLCAVIKQAVMHAKGFRLDCHGNPTKIRAGTRKPAAVEYLLSDNFDSDCMLLDLPGNFVERVRNMITSQQSCQMFALNFLQKDQQQKIIEEYKTNRTPQKILAKKYGVTQQRISSILPKRKHTRLTEQDAVNIREEYAYNGTRMKEIGKKYGYTTAVISHVINGNYKHLAAQILQEVKRLLKLNTPWEVILEAIRVMEEE